MRRSVVDETTGEVVQVLDEGDVILRRKSMEAWRNHVRMQYDEFVMVDQQNVARLYALASASELKLFLALLWMLPYHNAAVGRGGKMTVSELAGLCGMSRKTVASALDGLVAKEVAARSEDGIFLNPYIAMKGGKAHRAVLGMFQNTMWASEDGSVCD